jgi:hypothetical protein
MLAMFLVVIGLAVLAAILWVPAWGLASLAESVSPSQRAVRRRRR